MQSTGQNSDRKSYRVILLLVVGLAAFSSAMKELNQVHELTLQTSNLIAQVSDAIAPAEKKEILVQVETCEKILPPPAPVVPSIPPVKVPTAPSIRVLPPAPPAIRVVKPRRSVDKEIINLRNAINLIQKRDRRSNG